MKTKTNEKLNKQLIISPQTSGYCSSFICEAIQNLTYRMNSEYKYSKIINPSCTYSWDIM